MHFAKSQIVLAVLCCSICSTLGAQVPAAGTRSLDLRGTCDGSAAAWIDSDFFVDANDEDAVLRIYSARDGSMLPEASLDLASTLGLDAGGEPDIEGGARVGDRIYWITSHALDNDGVIRPERHRLFATSLTTVGGKPRLVPTGRVYSGLLKAIDDAAKKVPSLAELRLPAKARMLPETPSGLNIEALAEGENGSLLIGFRAPVAETGSSAGKALILPLVNPEEVVAAGSVAKAKFGTPVPLDLGGRGL